MHNGVYRTTALLMGLSLAPWAWGVEGFGIELGHGEGTDMGRLSARWALIPDREFRRNWTLGTFWESGIGYWQGNRSGGTKLWEIGLTPVFRLNSRESNFFWEGGIGVHFLSQSHIDGGREFGSHFSFAEHLGFGWHLSSTSPYEILYRFQHLSNANTAMPNDSINFHQVQFGFNY